MKLRIMLGLSLIPLIGMSQQKDSLKGSSKDPLKTSKIFKLGEIEVTSNKNDEMINRVRSNSMEQQNKMEVSKALNMLSGISMTTFGARNESMVNVRGFDLRQIPVYMDGIPIYVPYDGYVDLARFTTFDLAAIDVSKGFSSIIYGPNSLGGAINLISRKAIKKIEYDGALGMINTNGYKGNVNIGSNLGKFFVQAGYSYLHRNSNTISSNYTPNKNEWGGERDNSYRSDQKISFKLGFTPNEKHEYVIGYINQQGQKGTPVYCGTDVKNSMLTKPRYWQWPYWNKESYYFLSNTKLNEKNYVKARIYYDIFKNSIYSFDDTSYTTQKKPYAFQSWYNDYTYGGSLEYGTTLIPKNNLKLALHFKEDIHRENNLNEPVRLFEDNTMSVGLEDVFKVSDKFLIIPGVSYDERKSVTAEDYNSSTKTVSDFTKAGTSHAFNGQLGLFYYVNDNHKIGATVSHKTRFATIKDRYSYKMGTGIPNPDLKPEIADNYEINYNGTIFKKLTIHTALFYSHLKDAILNVSNVQPGKSQMQNFGAAEYQGAEFQANYNVFKNVHVGANYIERHNLTNNT
ncbi:MAG: TonB-dependent receptor, partial [Bacteroidetes bacterium]|nr:TonB-dependent receptor [Bacteroidota bacterium]